MAVKVQRLCSVYVPHARSKEFRTDERRTKYEPTSKCTQVKEYNYVTVGAVPHAKPILAHDAGTWRSTPRRQGHNASSTSHMQFISIVKASNT